MVQRKLPSGAKARFLLTNSGTAEAVPFPNPLPKAICEADSGRAFRRPLIRQVLAAHPEAIYESGSRRRGSGFFDAGGHRPERGRTSDRRILESGDRGE